MKVYVGVLTVKDIMVYDHENTDVRVVGVYKDIATAIAAMPYNEKRSFNFCEERGKLLQWKWEEEPMKDYDIKELNYRVVARDVQ